jgi:hypothetical protein
MGDTKLNHELIQPAANLINEIRKTNDAQRIIAVENAADAEKIKKTDFVIRRFFHLTFMNSIVISLWDDFKVSAQVPTESLWISYNLVSRLERLLDRWFPLFTVSGPRKSKKEPKSG